MFLTDVAGTLARLRTLLKPGGRLAASVWGPQPRVQMTAVVPIIYDELSLPAPPPGHPGMFALADPKRLAALLVDAGFRNVETGTINVVFGTDTLEEYTRFVRDVAPAMTEFVDGQPPDVRERVWRKMTAVWTQLQDADGRVRTENQAIWVVGAR